MLTKEKNTQAGKDDASLEKKIDDLVCRQSLLRKDRTFRFSKLLAISPIWITNWVTVFFHSYAEVVVVFRKISAYWKCISLWPTELHVVYVNFVVFQLGRLWGEYVLHLVSQKRNSRMFMRKCTYVLCCCRIVFNVFFYKVAKRLC